MKIVAIIIAWIALTVAVGYLQHETLTNKAAIEALAESDKSHEGRRR